ncbi:MAG: hypothetical protein U0Z53_13935 [Blastocatellia bacterium]
MKRTLLIALFAIAAQIVLLATAQADPSSGIVPDRQGRIYFADERRNIVWKIETDGRLIPFITGRHSHRLVIDADGNLHGEHLAYLGNDRWEFHLWKATPAGEVSYEIAPSPGFPPGLLTDRAGNRYQWGGSGNIRKTASLIERRAPDGKVTVIAGSGWGYADGRGDKALLGSVGGMAWGPDGALYVTDDRSVRRITTDGEVKTIARGDRALKPALSWHIFGGMGGNLFGLTVDEQANIYVANCGGGLVAKVTPEGKVSTLLESESGWAPTGVAKSGDDLYILEHSSGQDGPRVRKLASDGKVTTLAMVSANGQHKAAASENKSQANQFISGAMLPWLSILLLAALASLFWLVRR